MNHAIPHFRDALLRVSKALLHLHTHIFIEVKVTGNHKKIA